MTDRTIKISITDAQNIVSALNDAPGTGGMMAMLNGLLADEQAAFEAAEAKRKEAEEVAAKNAVTLDARTITVLRMRRVALSAPFASMRRCSSSSTRRRRPDPSLAPHEPRRKRGFRG